ncbi:MAG: GyrI-like domain-containing protein [Bacteroidaceae bacterium]
MEYCEAVGEPHDDTDILRFYEAPAIDQALCYRHRGPYTSFGESMARVMLYLDEHGWKPVGEPRFAYIDGAWNCDDPADWLTEIQVPVEKVEPETSCQP